MILILSTIFIFTTPLKKILIHEDWSKVVELKFSDDTPPDSVQLRLSIQRYFWGYLKEHPFEGVGFGGNNLDYISEILPDKPAELSHAHNTFFNIALQTGVQGLLGLLFVIFAQIRILWKGYQKAADPWDQYILCGALIYLIGIWIRLQFDDVYKYGTLLTYWIVMGVATGTYMKIVKLNTGAPQ